MRAVWLLVIACLVGATAVRPLHVERRDPQTPQLEVAPGCGVVVARRQAAHLPELRLEPFVLVATPVIAAPVMVAIGDLWHLATPTAACAAATARARGPPIA